MSEIPHPNCKLTVEILQQDAQGLQDYCKKCLRFGVSCFVEDHPLQAQQTQGN